MYALRLVSTVPGVPAPLDASVVRTHLRTPDGHDDTYITELVLAAMAAAELATHRRILTSTLELTIDRFPLYGEPIQLPGGSLQSVTSIQYTDAAGDDQTWGGANYTTKSQEPAEIWPAFEQTWPATRPAPGAVRVTYVCGYGATHDSVPTLLKHGMLMLVGHWYQNREAVVTGTITAELPLGAKHIFEQFALGDDFDHYDPTMSGAFRRLCESAS